MKKIDYYIFPYRDGDFYKRYGPIVRDLMIIESLSKIETTNKIYIFNRPLSIIEILFRNRKAIKRINNDKIIFFNRISFDLFGPIKRRCWLEKCYYKAFSSINMDKNNFNVVIDFLPIGELPSWTEKANFRWYDLIDNFTKHNRYSEKEKTLVKRKYEKVSKDNNVVTGVTKAALSNLEKGIILKNGLLKKIPYIKNKNVNHYQFDFGFIGFITNKFDIDIIRIISECGYTIGIWGDFYDAEIKQKIKSIKNITLYGRFKDEDVVDIMCKFKVGLVPYRLQLCHDESPLKIFQYLSCGHPVLSSSHFDIHSEYLEVYKNELDIVKKIKSSLSLYPIPTKATDQFYNENSYLSRLKPIIDKIEDGAKDESV